MFAMQSLRNLAQRVKTYFVKPKHEPKVNADKNTSMVAPLNYKQGVDLTEKLRNAESTLQVLRRQNYTEYSEFMPNKTDNELKLFHEKKIKDAENDIAMFKQKIATLPTESSSQGGTITTIKDYFNAGNLSETELKKLSEVKEEEKTKARAAVAKKRKIIGGVVGGAVVASAIAGIGFGIAKSVQGSGEQPASGDGDNSDTSGEPADDNANQD